MGGCVKITLTPRGERGVVNDTLTNDSKGGGGLCYESYEAIRISDQR